LPQRRSHLLVDRTAIVRTELVNGNAHVAQDGGLGPVIGQPLYRFRPGGNPSVPVAQRSDVPLEPEVLKRVARMPFLGLQIGWHSDLGRDSRRMFEPSGMSAPEHEVVRP